MIMGLVKKNLSDDVSVQELFELASDRPWSASLHENMCLARAVRVLAPCSLLVFGVGRDSGAWIEANSGGRTRFIENDDKWISRVSEEVGEEFVIKTCYKGTFQEWEKSGCILSDLLLCDLPLEIEGSRWDCIYVDGPVGSIFGRQQSVYSASKLIKNGGIVALHDCERYAEKLICERVLEAQSFELLDEVQRMRLYKSPF